MQGTGGGPHRGGLTALGEGRTKGRNSKETTILKAQEAAVLHPPFFYINEETESQRGCLPEGHRANKWQSWGRDWRPFCSLRVYFGQIMLSLHSAQCGW